MHRRIFYLGLICFLLTILAFTKQSAFAGSGPPPTPNPNRSPWITGQNADVVTNAGSERALEPAGVLVDSPSLFGLAFQENAAAAGELVQLAVPQRYQNPADPTCGAAALGMALDFLSLSEGGEVPDTNTLVQDLDASGFYYETGTGVEELAYIARSYGYRGSSPFHGWTLEDLAGELAAGRPVVVTLGKNGANQPGHFVTITGMSADGSWVRYNDPVLGQQTVSSEDFFEAWGSQGYSGLTIKKGELAAVSDPLLPWMGLLGSVSALAVLVKSYPREKWLTRLLTEFQGVLADPSRKGLGGKLALASGGGGNSSAPPFPPPAGYDWKKKTTPQYGWKDVTVIEKVQVPNMVRTWDVVRFNHWTETIPVYKTVKVDQGHWATRYVKKYRNERYRTTQRYRVKKTYWYRREGRLCRGIRYEWKTRTVWKTRKIPYHKQERYWVPKIVEKKRFVRFRQEEHTEPVYGWKMEQQGTKTELREKTEKYWGVVSTQTEWKLEKDDVQMRIPYNPKTATGDSSTPIWDSIETFTPEPSLIGSATPSASPTSSPTPSPTTTPTSLYDWVHFGTTTPESPTSTGTPVPLETKMAQKQENIAIGKTTSKGLYQSLKALDDGLALFDSNWAKTGWALDKQTPGMLSTALNGLSLVRKNQGASDNEVNTYKYGAKLADYYTATRLAYTAHLEANLLSAGKVLSNAGQAASQSRVSNPIGVYAGKIGKGFSDELVAIGERYVPLISKPIANIPASVLTIAARGLQAIASGLGLFAGSLQIRDAMQRFINDDHHDEWLGGAQAIGGLATIAGSGISLGAALGAISAPVIIGAAPVLLGVGAIVAGGALAYDLLKDTQAVKNLNQNLENNANQAGGFVDDAIATGQSMVEKGVPPALAVPSAIVDSTLEQTVESVKSTAQNTIDFAQSTYSKTKENLSDTFQPLAVAVDMIIQSLTNSISIVTKPIGDALNTTLEAINNTANNITESITNAVDNASNFLGN